MIRLAAAVGLTPVLIALPLSAPLGAWVAGRWGHPAAARRVGGWPAYIQGLLIFSAAGFLLVYAGVRVFVRTDPGFAFRTAMGALTWIDPQGESAPSPLPGLGLTAVEACRIILAGGVSLSIAAALGRGFAARAPGAGIGWFWSDLSRLIIQVLAPLALGSAAVALALRTAGPFLTGLGLGDQPLWTTLAGLVGPTAANAVRLAGAFALGRHLRAPAGGRALATAMAVMTLAGGLAATGVVAAGGPGDVLSRLTTTAAVASLSGGVEAVMALALLAACAGGLMIGRTPEYLGKRLGARTLRLALLGSFGLWAAIAGLTALAVLATGAFPPHDGPSGAWAAAALSVVCVLDRFGAAAPVMAIAGEMAARPRRSPTAGGLHTDGTGFAALLAALGLLVAAVRCLPLVALADVPHASAQVADQARGE